MSSDGLPECRFAKHTRASVSAILTAACPLRLVHCAVRVVQYLLDSSAIVAVHLDDSDTGPDRNGRVGDVTSGKVTWWAGSR
jgi:hypothetical protein